MASAGGASQGSVGFELQKCKGGGGWGAQAVLPGITVELCFGGRSQSQRIEGHYDSALARSQLELWLVYTTGYLCPPSALLLSRVLSLILRPASVPFVARQVHELAAAF